MRAVSEKPARARQRNGNNRHAGGHRRFECAKLKRANSIIRSKGALGKHENRFAAAPKSLPSPPLARAGIGGRVERKGVPLCGEKRSQQRPPRPFLFSQ